MSKRVLIIGIGGQDGSYIAELLIEKGYEVFGTSRRSSVDNLHRISHIKSKIQHLYQMELTDQQSISCVINNCEPDWIYHEADQDNVGWSYATPRYSVDVTAGGVSNLLETVRQNRPQCRVFIPVSSTIFGDTPGPQNEETPHKPLSPYACAKSHAYHLARYYRFYHDMYVSTAILYGHHSERRKQSDYLLGMLYEQVQTIKRNNGIGKVKVGCLDTVVDIGYAKEFAVGIYNLMQLPAPDDIVLGTGVGKIIWDITSHYIKRAGLDITNRIEHNPSPLRKGLTNQVADISKAKVLIRWGTESLTDALGMYDVLDKANQ